MKLSDDSDYEEGRLKRSKKRRKMNISVCDRAQSPQPFSWVAAFITLQRPLLGQRISLKWMSFESAKRTSTALLSPLLFITSRSVLKRLNLSFCFLLKLRLKRPNQNPSLKWKRRSLWYVVFLYCALPAIECAWWIRC